MKKRILTVFAIMAFTVIAGIGNSYAAPAKEKLTETLHSATIQVSDCL